MARNRDLKISRLSISPLSLSRKVSRAIFLAPNVVLSTIASHSIEKVSLFAKANKFPPKAKIYGSYEALLDDPDIDTVYLPLPVSLHVKWAVVLAQNKKHLLMEKPVALNVAEFDVIVKACEENGVQFMDGTIWVHNLRTAKMHEFLSDSERFGQLRVLKIHSYKLFVLVVSAICSEVVFADW
ncbi:hypothetical protein Ddye_012039 [Dipteronia dyeriana]|uniref:Gfo/Idh/MocA-like oxidoreductase N-terminal domain-containing protein n=1 Tax=Dipteronia dyeriana TaxID=168575 RepID=A0AAE0CIW8_9ROSI|nr:hypothetical protein Ddye_012039 [Dipteronia dyeriana]